jgi:polysaccharide biosynthesis protein VpsM
VNEKRGMWAARCCLLALAAVMVLAPTPASAVDLNAMWPDLGLPGFKLTPFVTERVEYESNVFQAHSGAQDDVISKTIPGFLLELPLGRHKVDLGFRTEILRYVDLTRQDTEHYFVLGNILLDFPGGLRINVKEDFARTSDPPGTELTGRIGSSTNVLTPSIEYRLVDRFAAGVEYVYTRVTFDHDTGVESLDRSEHTFGATGFYRVQPRTDLLLNVAYGFKEFDNDSSRDVHRYIVLTGVRGQITSRLTSTFRVGYEIRDPDHGDRGEYRGVVVGGDFVFRPTERTRITLVTQRSVNESIFAENFVYVGSQATLSLEHYLTRKLLVSARLFGANNDYLDKVRKSNGSFDWRVDWVGAGSLAVEYNIQRWLSVGADYTHTHRDSNFDNFDFKDDIVAAKVTLSF